MGDDEVYVLRRTVTEQAQTVTRLEAEIERLRAAVRRHRAGHGMAALAPEPVDADLWAVLDGDR